MIGGLAPDVLVIGGGVVGCAVAVHLRRAEPGIGATVIEPDPTCALAATARASAASGSCSAGRSTSCYRTCAGST